MTKKIFPKDIIEHSSETNFSKHSVRTRLIYITVLVAFTGMVVALPLIEVTVSVKSQGIIQPMTDRNNLVSLVPGHIEELHIKENTSVERGQVVARISSPVLEEQSNYIIQRKKKLEHYLSDLAWLTDLDALQFAGFYDETGEQVRETEVRTESETARRSAADPSPLLPYKEQILDAVQRVEQAGPESVGESGTVQNARAELWKLLHLNSAFLLNRLAPGEPEHSIYHQALNRFKQQTRPYLDEIAKIRENRIQNSPGSGPADDTGSITVQNGESLNNTWQQLLSTLNNSALQLLDNPSLVSTRNEANVAGKAKNIFEIDVLEPEEIHLETAKYRSSLLEFKQQARSTIRGIRRAGQNYDRQKKLFERDVISEEAYENSRFELEQARNDYRLLFEQQQNRWQADQVTYQDELEQLSSEWQQIEKEQERYILRAPVSGTIQNMTGVYEGSPVSANQTLAEISPDTALVVECYVPPKDIGLLQEGMKARFQVTAYDYNQWGLLTGEIREISDDVTVINNQPVFLVRASLDQTWLELPNGYRGNLKKGMSLVARFNVTDRSLFQLLYDKMDDWLNPAWNTPGETPSPQAQM